MTFTQTFGGTTIYPAGVSYRAVALSANQTLTWPVETATSNNIVAQIMDVTPSAGSLSIIMPPANEVSVGETTLFFNPSAFTFTVRDNGGNTIVAIAPGLSYQVYLIGNSTVNGTWRSTQYAAGTSVATAGSLVGAGIKAISTTLNQSMSVTTLNSNYAIGDADRSEAFVWNGGAGAFTLPSSGTVGNDWFCQIRNSGTGAITLTPTGAELINGAANLTFNPGDSAIVICDGSAFFTIGFGQSAAFAFDYVSIDLSSPVTSPYTLSGANLNRIAYSFGGTLTTNMEVLIPATIQQYWISNDTSGAFTLTVKVAGQTGVVVPQGSRGIYYCNGTDIIDADTASFAFPLTVAQGGTGATTQSGARINLGGTSVGIGVFTAVTAADGRVALIAAKSDANSDITSLTGLTTPLSVPQGGTGVATLTANGVLYGSGASALAVTAVGTTGQVLVGNTGAAPTWSTLSGIGVTSFSAGTTGLTPSTATTGVVTLAGTLAVANGGTGVTTSTGTTNVVLSNSPTLVTPTLGAASATSITNALGAVGTPSYTFTGDTNTGIYSPAADTIAFVEGGAEAMRIDSSGNVGINCAATALSNYRGIELAGAATTQGGFLRMRTSDSSVNSLDFLDTNGRAIFTTTSHPVRFGTNDTERARIDSSGNVGIGTSSPSMPLNVSKNGTDSGLGYSNVSKFVDGSGNKGLIVGYDNSAQTTVLTANSTSASSNMAFWTYEAGGSGWAERMRVTAAGNVGIGTSSPVGKIDYISGSARVYMSDQGSAGFITAVNTTNTAFAPLALNGSILILKTGDAERARIDSSGNLLVGATTGNGRLTVRGTGTGATYSFEAANSTGATRFIVSDNGEASFYNSSSAISMRISSTGDVGIGISAPAYKLDVRSGATATAGQFNSTATTAYNPAAYNGGAARLFMYGGSAADSFTGTQYTHGGNFEAFFGVVQNASNLADFVFQGYNGSVYQERMRISSAGNLLVGTTSASSLSGDAFLYSPISSNIALCHSSSIVSGTNYIGFLYNGSTIGSITQSGTTAVLYNVTSDARLKENIANADDAASLIDALQVRKFDWKADNSHQRYGFVAQELLEVAPEAVHQPADPDEMMAVDYSKLVPMLVKELQSLRARVAQLEGN